MEGATIAAVATTLTRFSSSSSSSEAGETTGGAGIGPPPLFHPPSLAFFVWFGISSSNSSTSTTGQQPWNSWGVVMATVSIFTLGVSLLWFLLFWLSTPSRFCSSNNSSSSSSCCGVGGGGVEGKSSQTLAFRHLWEKFPFQRQEDEKKQERPDTKRIEKELQHRPISAADSFQSRFLRNWGQSSRQQQQQQQPLNNSDSNDMTSQLQQSQQPVNPTATEDSDNDSKEDPSETSQQSESAFSLQWWEDFVLPSFRFPLLNSATITSLMKKTITDASMVAGVTTADQDVPKLTADPNADIVHFIFLCHGHRGFARDLGYVQAVMQRQAAIEKLKPPSGTATAPRRPAEQREDQESSHDNGQFAAHNNNNNNNHASSSSLSHGEQEEAENGIRQSVAGDEHPPVKRRSVTTAVLEPVQERSNSKSQTNKQEWRHDMVIHSSVCNEGKTTDGVVAGGERLVEEIMTVIRSEMQQRRAARRKQRQEEQDQREDDAASGATSTAGIYDEYNVDTAMAEDFQTEEDDLPAITISILGNSLGGLYGRYAVAKLAEICPKRVVAVTKPGSSNGHATHEPIELEEYYLLDGKYKLYLNIFCTTATPHLGVASHTFLPLPRTAEIGVAHAMGVTGKDLFRLNDLMKTMATSPYFVQPLAAFRKRIAYANAYGTDFPVPVHTAAFLNEGSEYPHHFVNSEAMLIDEDGDGGGIDRLVFDDNGMVVATLHTPAQVHHHQQDRQQFRKQRRRPSQQSGEMDDGAGPDEKESDEDDLVDMSISLDALGWKKVFVDMRKEIPRIDFPKSLIRRNMGNTTTTGKTGSNSTLINSFLSGISIVSSPSSMGGVETIPSPASSEFEEKSKDDNDTVSMVNSSVSSSSPVSSDDEELTPFEQRRKEALTRLRERGVVGSKELAATLNASPMFEESIFWPGGHNMIVAFSRSRFSTYMNKGGRPVVDALAKELVQDIFSWQPKVRNSPKHKATQQSPTEK